METLMNISPMHVPREPMHELRANMPVPADLCATHAELCLLEAGDQAHEALIELCNAVWPRERGGAERQASDMARFGYPVDPSTLRRLRARTTRDVSQRLAVAIDLSAQRVEIERENARIRRRNILRRQVMK